MNSRATPVTPDEKQQASSTHGNHTREMQSPAHTSAQSHPKKQLRVERLRRGCSVAHTTHAHCRPSRPPVLGGSRAVSWGRGACPTASPARKAPSPRGVSVLHPPPAPRHTAPARAPPSLVVRPWCPSSPQVLEPGLLCHLAPPLWAQGGGGWRRPRCSPWPGGRHGQQCLGHPFSTGGSRWSVREAPATVCKHVSRGRVFTLSNTTKAKTRERGWGVAQGGALAWQAGGPGFKSRSCGVGGP